MSDIKWSIISEKDETSVIYSLRKHHINSCSTYTLPISSDSFSRLEKLQGEEFNAACEKIFRGEYD